MLHTSLHIYFRQRFFLTLFIARTKLPSTEQCVPKLWTRTLLFTSCCMRHALHNGLNAHEFFILEQSNRKMTMFGLLAQLKTRLMRHIWLLRELHFQIGYWCLDYPYNASALTHALFTYLEYSNTSRHPDKWTEYAHRCIHSCWAKALRDGEALSMYRNHHNKYKFYWFTTELAVERRRKCEHYSKAFEVQ